MTSTQTDAAPTAAAEAVSEALQGTPAAAVSRREAAATEAGPAAPAAAAPPPDPAPAAAPEVELAAVSDAAGRRSGDGERSTRPRAPRAPRAAPAEGQRPPAAPRGFPRAERPAPVPQPQHHHLPGWVRRDFARARPALADLLGLLQGDERATLQRRVDEVTAGIAEGKFSLAWQYPQIISEGREAYERQRQEIAETQRAHRALDTARRRAATRLRDAGDQLGSDAAARLNRALRGATDAAAIAAVEAEVDTALSTARTATTRRRDREIEKTRAKILRSTPRDAAAAEDTSESWQDVLRRFADEQLAGSRADAD